MDSVTGISMDAIVCVIRQSPPNLVQLLLSRDPTQVLNLLFQILDFLKQIKPLSFCCNFAKDFIGPLYLHAHPGCYRYHISYFRNYLSRNFRDSEFSFLYKILELLDNRLPHLSPIKGAIFKNVALHRKDVIIEGFYFFK